jgi:AAA+ superfamily predicted ATPase
MHDGCTCSGLGAAKYGGTAAGDLYYRLVLLAGPQGTGKTSVLQALAKENQYPLINVNLQLCKGMLELTRNGRTRQVERLFKAVVGSGAGDVVLLDTLSGDGAPCTVEQLRIRLVEFLQKITRGREAAKVRLIIVRGEQKAGES